MSVSGVPSSLQLVNQPAAATRQPAAPAAKPATQPSLRPVAPTDGDGDHDGTVGRNVDARA
jgi:hypothetical protein